MTLASVVITEFISKALTLLLTGIFYKYLLGAPAAIDVTGELVWVLYYQLLIWINLVFFPYVVVATPIIIYLLFQCYYITMTYLS